MSEKEKKKKKGKDGVEEETALRKRTQAEKEVRYRSLKVLLIEEALAAYGTAETRDTIRSINLTLEFVIVGEFLI